VRGDELNASQTAIDKINESTSGVDVQFNTVVEAFEGKDSKLSTVKIKNTETGETDELNPAAAFVFIGQNPNTEILEDYAELDEYGFALTGHDVKHRLKGMPEPLPFETSMPGIFVAGDARHNSTKQVASAVGEGAAASISIRGFMRRSE
jgi:thioredoxin reductase (NADPH)